MRRVSARSWDVRPWWAEILLLHERGRLLAPAVVAQRRFGDDAEIETLEVDLLGISGPLDLDIPGAAVVGVIEFDVDGLPVREACAQLVLAEVIVVRRIDA